MCDDLEATMREFAARGAELGSVTAEPWGRRTSIRLPGGAALGFYQPSHALAVDLPAMEEE